MTRANAKPLRRVVLTSDGEMVAEVTDRTLALRPLKTRRGGPAEVVLTWGSVYLRAMLARVDEEKRARKRARKEKRKL